jgi:two-component system, NarL family, nitrate/nitrite response regulator NarL
VANAAAPPTARLRIVLAGGHALYRQALVPLLAGQGFDVVGEGDELQAAWGAALDPPPDGVLFDIDRMPEGAPLVMQDIRRRAPDACVVVLTAGAGQDLSRRLVLEGARGIVSKDRGPAHLCDAIRAASSGELWIDRATTARIIGDIAARRGRALEPEQARIATLTAREREVVGLVAQGRSNKAIAEQLAISGNTVRHHLTSIFAKLDLDDRVALVVYTFKHRIA